MAKYEPTIGLEIHAELKTKTKMFCDSLNDPDEKHPNLNVCPVCLGHPGTLPAINREAIRKLVKVGLALNCQISDFSKFDRKNYFYPDLPKSYQISQYDLPVCREGWLEVTTKEFGARRIGLERIHIEEDTGRLLHPEGADYSLVDYNRAGVPLMELVTKPDLKSGREIEEFAKELQLILRYLGASDADMEKGQMRVEVNISVKPVDNDKLGTKVELKNINSIRAASAAADYEVIRQTEALESGGGLVQETRGWDEKKSKTFSQRVKETSADYRYFPEPDLPPLTSLVSLASDLRTELPELPAQRRVRFKKNYGLNDAQTEIFTIAWHLGNYYENVASEIDSWSKLEHKESGVAVVSLEDESHLPGRLHALAANYLITEYPPLFQTRGLEIDDIEGIKITPEAFAQLMVKIYHQELSSTAAKAVLKEMFETGLTPEEITGQKDLGQISDVGELEKAVDDAIAKNRRAVEDYKKGKVKAVKFLIGQVMALTRGKANPQVVSQILERKLK